MEDINTIVNRNTIKLNELINQYEIDRTFKQIVNNFDRIYVHNDEKTERIRLLGIERQYDTADKYIDENGNVQLACLESEIKTKRIQLYVLKKKDYISYSDIQKEELMYHLNFFIALYKQLKYVSHVESIEYNSMSLFKIKGYL